MPTEPRARLDRVWPWLGGVLLAAPILGFRYPPMGDLPMHEALVSMMRHLDDPAWMPRGMARLVVPQANQLFHFVAVLLAYVVPTDVACKLVVALTVLLTPVATARWLHELGRARWPSLLVAPLACGWMFRWGLAANMMGFALALAFLPLLERLSRRATPRRSLEAAAATVVIFFAHESAAVIFGAVAAYYAIIRGAKMTPFALRIAPVVVAGVLAFAQSSASRALAGANMTMIGDDHGPSALARVELLPGAVFGPYDGARLAAIGGVSVVGLLACALVRARRRTRSLPLRAALHRRRHAVIALLLFLAFLAFPMTVGGNTLLAFRFLPAACAFAIVACAPSAGRAAEVSELTRARARGALAACALAPLTMLAIELSSFLDADARFRALDDIIARIPQGVAVAQLDLTPNKKGVALVPGAPSRVQATRGGRMLFQLTDMPPNPVYLRPDARWDEPLLRMVHAPFAFLPEYDTQRFSYILVIVAGHWPRYRADVAKALEPDAVLVASAGEWDLYRSTRATTPVDAPDRALPDPPPENLADRVKSVRSRASE